MLTPFQRLTRSPQEGDFYLNEKQKLSEIRIVKNKQNASFQQYNRVLQYLNESPNSQLALKIEESLCIIHQTIKRYKRVFFSFNGGKDSTVLLHLIRIVILKLYNLEEIYSLNTVPTYETLTDMQNRLVSFFYLHTSPEFPELAKFLIVTDAEYALNTKAYASGSKGFKDTMFRFCREQSPDACFLGVRATDPEGRSMHSFSPNSPGWPKMMRVAPVLNWNYTDVWDFLIRFDFKYCSLYDRGYCSLGSVKTTVQHPSLIQPINNLESSSVFQTLLTERYGKHASSSSFHLDSDTISTIPSSGISFEPYGVKRIKPTYASNSFGYGSSPISAVDKLEIKKYLNNGPTRSGSLHTHSRTVSFSHSQKNKYMQLCPPPSSLISHVTSSRHNNDSRNNNSINEGSGNNTSINSAVSIGTNNNCTDSVVLKDKCNNDVDNDEANRSTMYSPDSDINPSTSAEFLNLRSSVDHNVNAVVYKNIDDNNDNDETSKNESLCNSVVSDVKKVAVVCENEKSDHELQRISPPVEKDPTNDSSEFVIKSTEKFSTENYNNIDKSDNYTTIEDTSPTTTTFNTNYNNLVEEWNAVRTLAELTPITITNHVEMAFYLQQRVYKTLSRFLIAFMEDNSEKISEIINTSRFKVRDRLDIHSFLIEDNNDGNTDNNNNSNIDPILVASAAPADVLSEDTNLHVESIINSINNGKGSNNSPYLSNPSTKLEGNKKGVNNNKNDDSLPKVYINLITCEPISDGILVQEQEQSIEKVVELFNVYLTEKDASRFHRAFSRCAYRYDVLENLLYTDYSRAKDPFYFMRDKDLNSLDGDANDDDNDFALVLPYKDIEHEVYHQKGKLKRKEKMTMIEHALQDEDFNSEEKRIIIDKLNSFVSKQQKTVFTQLIQRGAINEQNVLNSISGMSTISELIDNDEELTQLSIDTSISTELLDFASPAIFLQMSDDERSCRG